MGPGPTGDPQRIWHPTLDQTFTDLMSYQFRVKAETGKLMTGLWNNTAKQFWGMSLSVDEDLWQFFYGNDSISTVLAGDCRAGDEYLVIATLDFPNHRIRTTVENLTDETQPLVDSGDLLMDVGTTTANAGSDATHTGMRYLGAGVFDPAEIRVDEIGFNLTSVSLPGSLTGHVEFQDYIGSNWLVPIEIELIPQETGTALTKKIYLDINNDYVLDNVDVGIYDVAFNACKWLRTVVTGKEVTSENTTQCDVSLVSGDVDGDDEVTTTDLSVVLSNAN